jgi:hypothetical protein
MFRNILENARISAFGTSIESRINWSSMTIIQVYVTISIGWRVVRGPG